MLPLRTWFQTKQSLSFTIPFKPCKNITATSVLRSYHSTAPRPSLVVYSVQSRFLSLPKTHLHRADVYAQRRAFTNNVQIRRQYERFDPPRSDRPKGLFTRHQVAVAAGVLIVGYVVVHLERVPETGRWRFIDISPRIEAILADAMKDSLLSEYEEKVLPPNHIVTRHVRRIVSSILEASNLGVLSGGSVASNSPDMPRGADFPDDVFDPDKNQMSAKNQDITRPREWNLLVVNDDKVANAMASYGSIVVFTGILPICQDEHGLAAVLGHEIGHVVARHSSEKYSNYKLLLFATFAIEATLGFDFGLTRLAVSLLLDLPNSRNMELEADKIGMRLSSRACFDPRAHAEVQSRLGKLEASKGRFDINFLYTHPTSKTRIKLFNEMLPEAYAIQAASPACSQIHDQLQAFSELNAFV